jgi:hypothetical protein
MAIIDFEKYKRTAENETVSRHLQPQRGTRPQPEREKMPDWYERTQNYTRDFGGGAFAGRSWGGGRTVSEKEMSGTRERERGI